jgi:hypothetical protein
MTFVISWPARPQFQGLGAKMGEVIRFIPKAELERARLVREARAIYESIFPQAVSISEARELRQ